MTIWKDGGMYGKIRREIVKEKDGHPVGTVRVNLYIADGTEPWSEGEANFRLILKAPLLLEALEAIRDKAERILQIIEAPKVPATWADWQAVRAYANTAIAAVKGEQGDEKA